MRLVGLVNGWASSLASLLCIDCLGGLRLFCAGRDSFLGGLVIGVLDIIEGGVLGV